MSAQAIKFRIFKSGELVGEQTLFNQVVKIGAGPASHLRLEGTGVAKMHAVVEIDRSGDLHVVDLGSSAGTVLGGRRITRAALESGDRISIGELEIEVVLEGRTEAQNAAPPIPARSQAEAAAPAMATPAAGAQVSAARAFDPALVANLAAVEDPSRPAVEVVVLWNGSVLQVEHLAADDKKTREFSVGEDPACDFPIPAEELGGATRFPLVHVGQGAAEVTVPAGASGDLTEREGRRTDLAELVTSGAARPSGRAQGAYCLPVTSGARLKIDFGVWTFLVNGVAGPRKLVAPAKLDFSKQIFTGFSLGLHALFFFLIAFVPPSPEGLALDLLEENNRFIPYMIAAAEVHQDKQPDWLPKKPEMDNDKEGRRHEGEEGKMGDRTAKKTDSHYGIKGPKDFKNPVMARDRIKDLVQHSGVLAYLSAANAPTSPFGAEVAKGNDPENALGALLGNQYGANFGYEGLGVYGTGRGGGGDGRGTIGLGDLNTIGRGCRGYNCGPGGPDYGKPSDNLTDRRPVNRIRIKDKGAMIVGSLSKEAIRRVVRRHINEVKFCYERGLAKRADLEGRVAIKFLINGKGAVQNSAVALSTLDDPGVAQCVARSVRRWTFPQPVGGGVVIVTYPFHMTGPGE
jgi:hypothetical protein